MKKTCVNCGAEFTGNFCSECGTRWEEAKVCPECGTVLSGVAKFCNECGHAFVQSVATTAMQTVQQETATTVAASNAMIEKVRKNREESMQKFYSALKFVPSIVFFLFSALLFAFYATPVAEMVIGGGFPNESLGSVYSMYSGILGTVPEIGGAMIALIILAAISASVAILVGVLSFLPKMRYKAFKLKNSEMPMITALALIPFVFYLIIFIVGIVIIAQIVKIDDGLGLIKAGPLSTLLIIFSLIFMIFGALPLIVRRLMYKNNPVCAQTEITLQEAYVLEEIERREKFYATHTAPISPVLSVAMPTRAEKKEFKRKVVVYKHAKRRYDKAIDGDPSKKVIWLDLHKGALISVTAFLIVAITLLCILIPIFTSIFRIKVVEKIELGYTQEQVREILGDPYADASSDTAWLYYDGEYVDHVNKMQENARKQEEAVMNGDVGAVTKLMQEQAALQSEYEQLVYAFIEVRFDTNGIVTEVLLDTKRKGSGQSESKTFSKGEFVEAEPYEGLGLPGAIAKIEYTDGSYRLKYYGFNEVTGSNGNVIPTTKISRYSNYTAKISDEWGEYELVLSTSGYLSLIETTDAYGYKYKGSPFMPYAILTDAPDDIVTANISAQCISIEDGAFKGCSSLTSITIPDGVTSIGRSAFV